MIWSHCFCFTQDPNARIWFPLLLNHAHCLNPAPEPGPATVRADHFLESERCIWGCDQMFRKRLLTVLWLSLFFFCKFPDEVEIFKNRGTCFPRTNRGTLTISQFLPTIHCPRTEQQQPRGLPLVKKKSADLFGPFLKQPMMVADSSDVQSFWPYYRIQKGFLNQRKPCAKQLENFAKSSSVFTAVPQTRTAF